MSRKRKQRSKAQAVPEEVLAEGSGPVGPAPEAQTESPDVIVESTDDSFEETILPAAADVQDAPGDEPLEAASDEPTDEAIGEAIEDPVDDPTDGSVERAAEAASDDAVEPMQMVPDETIEVVDLIDPVDGADEPVATLPTSAGSMDAAQLKLLVEALVFASDKPITVARLRQLTRVSDTKRLEQALAELTQDYGSRGLVLQQVSGGYQFRTRSQFSGWVQQLIAGRPVRLSRAQLETLAIIAYRQPITRPEIDDIRGVDSSGTLKVLIDRALIRILGKKEEVGRPMLYGTTKEFLDFFSLGDLRELPTLREYSELTDESRRVMTDRLGLPPDGNHGGGEGEGGASGDGGGSMPPPAEGGQGGEPLGASADDELQVPDVELAAASASFEAVEASEAAEASEASEADADANADSEVVAAADAADPEVVAASDADADADSEVVAAADGAVSEGGAAAVAAADADADAIAAADSDAGQAADPDSDAVAAADSDAAADAFAAPDTKSDSDSEVVAAADADAVADADAESDSEVVAATDAESDSGVVAAADVDATTDGTTAAGADGDAVVPCEAAPVDVDAIDANEAGEGGDVETELALSEAIEHPARRQGGDETEDRETVEMAAVTAPDGVDPVDADSSDASHAADLDALNETITDGKAMLADDADADADAVHASQAPSIAEAGASGDGEAMGFVDEETISGTSDASVDDPTDDSNGDSTPRMRARRDADDRGPHLAEGSGPMMAGARENVLDDEAPAAGDDLSPELLRAAVEPADDPSVDPTRD